MPKRTVDRAAEPGGTDEFTRLLNGDPVDQAASGAPAARGARGARPGTRADRPDPADTARTERFGWGAAAPAPAHPYPARPAEAAVPYPVAPVDPGPYRESEPAAVPGHPGYGGYTTAVEPVPEAILLRVRPHARRLVLPVLILFGTVTAFGWFAGSFAEEWQNWLVFGGACALVFFGVLLPCVAWLGHRYTITTRRIIARRGLFISDRQTVPLARVTDIRLRRGPVAAAFASGDIRVTAGPDLTVTLHDVPSARLTAALLSDLTEHPVPPGATAP